MYLIGFSHCSGKFNRQLYINVSQKPVTFSATRLERHAGQSHYEGYYSFTSGTPLAPAALVPACNAPVANENIPCTVPEIVERDVNTVSINMGTFQRHLEHYHSLPIIFYVQRQGRGQMVVGSLALNLGQDQNHLDHLRCDQSVGC
jgi:hypothetical protein